MMKPRVTVFFLILDLALAGAGTANAQEKLEYNRHIRPILAENCFACHGPDSASRKAGLRLDRRDDAIKAGVLVPGKADDSDIVARINQKNPNKRMPPPKSHKTLTQAQKDTLRRWIAAGAEYQPHWSLLAVKRPPLPQVKNAAWVRNPIDRFILAELDKHGLKPAPEADRRTLARRLSLDLTGLPPEPADVEAFVNDKSTNAYEKLVDKFLASPHWGEHRGRYWLDVARYGDTHGIHFDNYRENWAFRDWVIRAFNANMPFDQFTIEQLAGDLLPKRTIDQQIGSGFNRCNITTNEGGVIPEEYLVLYTRDRTETTAQVWMGMTAGCAVCHDHKFDPLSQREFYRLAAFFNNTTQGAMDGNIKDTPPVIIVPRMEDRGRWDTLVKEVGDMKAKTDARKQAARSAFAKWLKEAKADAVTVAALQDQLRFHAALSEGSGEQVTLVEDGKPRTAKLARVPTWVAGHVAAKAFKPGGGAVVASRAAGDFEKDQPFTVSVWVKPTKNNLTGAVVARMDETNKFRGWDLFLEGGRPTAHLVSAWQDDAIKVNSKTFLKPNQWHHVTLSYDGSGKASGVRLYADGKPLETTVFVDRLSGSIRTDKPLQIGRRFPASSPLTDIHVQDLRVYSRPLTGPEAALIARTTRAALLVAKAADKRSPAEQNELFDWFLTAMDKEYGRLAAQLGALVQEQTAIKSRGTVAHVMQERTTPPEAFVLFRGDYDKRREKVTPATPEALPPMSAELPRNRLGLAQWLLRPEHPLTARVTVNRFWQEVFGTGLVRTTGDFGVTGELPSHPELLDWLAVEFREKHWDVKQFFKLIVTSAAYRQAATVSKEALHKDPHNRLLSRGPRYRLDAEMIRDYALAASRLLVRKLGGPSVKPYQPEGVWEAVAMNVSNTSIYRRDRGENLYRRSMYTFWKRGAPPASMEIFNAPTREFCTVRRERTNTPLQALVTLNDVQFVEAARHLATAALKQGGDRFEGRADFMARRLLARPFSAAELKVLREVFADLHGFYKSHPNDARQLLTVGESVADTTLDPPTLAAWTMLANQLMNLDEVLNK